VGYTLVQGESLDHEIRPQETRIIALSYSIDIFADDYFILSQCTRLTDRRTDGRTDRQTEGRQK